jgi:hypothetical protein
MWTPFSPGLYPKPGQMSWAYIYGRTPSPLSLVFFLNGVWVCASFIFYSYALEVFVKMCVRAMPLKFTEHNFQDSQTRDTMHARTVWMRQKVYIWTNVGRMCTRTIVVFFHPSIP